MELVCTGRCDHIRAGQRFMADVIDPVFGIFIFNIEDHILVIPFGKQQHDCHEIAFRLIRIHTVIPADPVHQCVSDFRLYAIFHRKQFSAETMVTAVFAFFPLQFGDNDGKI